MFLLDSERLGNYLQDDWVLERLRREERSGDAAFISHRWLESSPGKRLMYACVYGDLFDRRGLRILDVGGGFCSLSRLLLRDHAYRLLELAAHDSAANLRAVERSTGASFWIEGDWYSQPIEGTFDIVLANDLFPNVDQRLALFIERFLPLCREMRLSLTYYNHPRFYLTKRLDGEEVLCMLAWNGEQTKQVLSRYVERIDGFAVERFQQHDTVFENGRQVCIVRLRGGGV